MKQAIANPNSQHATKITGIDAKAGDAEQVRDNEDVVEGGGVTFGDPGNLPPSSTGHGDDSVAYAELFGDSFGGVQRPGNGCAFTG